MPQDTDHNTDYNLFDDIPAGICRFRLDERLTIADANERFFGLFGYTREQALQENFDSVCHLLDEQEKERLYQLIQLLKKNEIPEKGEFEFTVHPTPQQPVIVLARYHYRRPDSKHITINVIDITDRKHMENELRISEKRYKLALSQSGKVFFFFDAKTQTMHLPDELAIQFGLPNVVDDMPDNPLSTGLVEPESQDIYKAFFHRILQGAPSGEALISGHMRTQPDKINWYRLAFTSVLDEKNQPLSTIVTCEEYTERYRSEIDHQWQQANIHSLSNGDFYLSVEYDLTRGIRQKALGEMAWMFDTGGLEYETVFAPLDYGIVSAEDAAAYRLFFLRKRLLALFESGVREDVLECHMMQHENTEPKWVQITVRMIPDPYTGHVLSQSLFKDIHTEKNRQLLVEKNMEELQQKLEASRAKAMIAQMQPHFLYNALSAIRTIIRRDPEKAYHLLYDFTVHLRSSIKAISSDDPITFHEELTNIQAYLNIEMMRFEDSLHVNYEIDSENFMVIPLSIQPLAENAARHGIYGKGRTGGTITIRSYEAADAYIVEVEDDGCGFHVEDALRENNNSYGLKNLLFRLETLMNATVKIQSEIDHGTLVRVFFPKGGAN